MNHRTIASWLGTALLIAMTLCAALPARAASVGTPAGTEENRLDLGVEYSHLFDRELEAPAQESDELGDGMATHVRAGWALFEWLQPYMKVGAAQFDEELGNVNIAGLGRRNVDLEYDWGLSWGGGLAGTYTTEEGWFVGYDGQFLTSDHDLDGVRHNGEAGSAVTGEVSLQEWHFAAYAGRKFALQDSDLSIYVGGRWSDLELDIDKDLEYTVSEGTIGVTGETDADDQAGPFAGIKWRHSSRWAVELEGRFLDETALTGRASYTF